MGVVCGCGFSCGVCKVPLCTQTLSASPGVLTHVVTIVTPAQFLSLLPASGSLDFFLPFIQRSCCLHAAQGVAKQLHSTVLHK